MLFPTMDKILTPFTKKDDPDPTIYYGKLTPLGESKGWPSTDNRQPDLAKINLSSSLSSVQSFPASVEDERSCSCMYHTIHTSLVL